MRQIDLWAHTSKHQYERVIAQAVGQVSAADTVANIVGPLLIVLVLICAIALIVLIARRRQIVFRGSSALIELAALNAGWQASVQPRVKLSHRFRINVNSKSKFDRFDLAGQMAANVLENKAWFHQEIQSRVEATSYFNSYQTNAGLLAGARLGKSADRRVAPKHFVDIEQKAFTRRTLKYPVPLAEITSTVSYVSPQGKNSYSSHLTWNFDQLLNGYAEATSAQERMSTEQALRQHERRLMTSGLRMSVLRRDSNRCQICGASAKDGATLHVDHITPVSWGGLTVAANLQTLCVSCNLGKSNKFAG